MPVQPLQSDAFPDAFPDAFQRDPYAVIAGKLGAIEALLKELHADLERLRQKEISDA